MLTIKSESQAIRRFFREQAHVWRGGAAICGLVLLLGLVFLSGCSRSGSGAFTKGKELFDRGRFAEAMKEFQSAALGLSTNAIAWHYLGLAAHYAHQPAEAERAYARALTLNRDLVEARYNLGCLLLEQNRSDEAKAQLITYNLHRGNSLDGCLKLGSAQLRTRDPLGAEKTFGEALRLSPTNSEALNGVALARMQRGRVSDAVQYFNAALRSEPHYAPALLNLGVVRQQYLKDLPAALVTYKEYLRVQPEPGQAKAVTSIVAQLERTLAPPVRSTTVPATTTVAESSAPPAGQVPKPPEKTPPPQTQNLASVRRPAPVPPQKSLQENSGSAAPATLRQEVPASSPQTVTTPASNRNNVVAAPADNPPARPETVKLPAEPAVKPADDQTPRPPQTAAERSAQMAKGPVIADDVPPGREKRGFLQSINPLNLLQSDNGKKTTPPPVTNIPRQPASTPAAAVDASATLTTGPRYRYRNPPKPAIGNRAEAQRALAQGIAAQNARRFREAVQAYRQAIQIDPSLFEAHYNLGLAQTSLGNIPAALAAYEDALAAQPRSPDARFNLAVTLRDANYLADAMNELNTVLRLYPNETRAHLALANIYSQQLGQPSKARPYYLKVVELEPRHPQANAIRYWLAAHPG